jgi:seryl-tRNA synthetase
LLDIKYIRENADAIIKGAADKRLKIDLTELLRLDSEIRPKQTELENFLAERNRLSKTIGQAAPAARDVLKADVAKIKIKLEGLEADLKILKEKFNGLMLLVPQPARADVPIGKDDSENVQVKTWGTPPKFDFPTKDHMELGKLHDIIDVPRGVKLAGARSYILKGYGAMLEQAIMRYTYDKLIKKGYTPLSIPVLVTEQAMEGTGYFPTGREQAYFIEKDALALVGTGEVSLTSYHADEILTEKELPIRFIAQSSCFRREAGTYGKDTSGLYRVHQFQKIEQVIVAPADPKLSEKLHDELLLNAEEVLQDLELAYRVVYVCTGDLGQGQVRKHDIETWMPSRKAYSETHSCSTFHDFQARRLKMRYKTEAGGETKTCYTLNNTAIASPRVLIPLLENHQQKDGSIKIPKCLHPYLPGLTLIEKS